MQEIQVILGCSVCHMLLGFKSKTKWQDLVRCMFFSLGNKHKCPIRKRAVFFLNIFGLIRKLKVKV